MSVRNLEALFAPASVAVVGVPERPGQVGNVVLRNLQQAGFQGPLWIVDRHASVVGGLQAFPDVDSLPQAPDLAVVCTPAAAVPSIIEALARKGTRAAAVITAGLRHTPAEQAMLAAARPALLRILGPNCLGVLVPGAGLNASFAPGNAQPGSLAFVTQSGALATAMLDWANGHGIGFSHFVSLGDCADVDFGDVLDYLASDPGTRAILMYMEAVTQARKFMSAARAAARNKPVIVVKAGRAPEGARAAASHTGALAGSDAVFDAAVRRAGMLRVDTLEDLFDAAQTLAHVKAWRGERLAILTNGGGAGVLAVDALMAGRGRLAELGPATLRALDECLPDSWPRANPVDIIGDAPVARYADALRVLLAAPEVDGVLFMHAPTAIVPAAEIAAACLPLVRAAAKPVLACWLGGQVVAGARQAFSGAGIATYGTPERAVAAWLQRASYARNQEALLQLPAAMLGEFRPDAAAADAVLQEALREGREWLDSAQTARLLQAYGIPAVASVKVRDAEEAVLAAASIGFPVALKVVSPEIVHKSDVGGVALGLASADEVRAAAVKMRQRIAHAQPQAHVLGFTVQAMAQRRRAQELIVGIASDAVFGPVVLFGEGGTAVELRKDRAVGLPPLNERLARDLVDQTHVGALLAGWRGQPPVDQRALLGTILKVSQMACDLPALQELDINPLLADAQGVLALDARVRVRRPAPGEPSRLAVRPYPGQLEERVTLGDSVLLLRPIRPEDGERLTAFYAGASPADMRLRFFLSRREVPHSELARYCQIDYEREMTFVAIDPQAAAGDGMAGEVRAVCDPDNLQAEFAIQVAGPWQRRGLGRALMDKLLRYLRERGTGEVVGECLAENAGMAALARKLGFRVTLQPEGVMAMRLTLPAAG
ncbi:bifunctional acetate--CoA ligase family protein/GNAT family N-acetyltransferase [Ramlibacter sp. RBP-2]|uniref:Bifunctional acetate--CoA ligase family protein/GNAT family N-acetyltransferase n=1 Tax=Ramlibacter lithotrophicus TaxID=2606681 RepID=A0A7X6DEH5_9BURK|nr:bifunctional acetate--CoA ligase family protein/GNAT family N-acetyltransferase [Ramlibacter lithotrophicus]NKE65687.1 bifunctional acetate--CoA ligase family protein/GNAT family N-acetyltransferase [Ramlibacter lithotrophicus]